MTDAATDNPEKSRYELRADGGMAIAAYERQGDVLTFTHTIVPEASRGHGIASAMIGSALADVRRRHLRIRASCPFVIEYLARHPDARDLLAD